MSETAENTNEATPIEENLNASRDLIRFASKSTVGNIDREKGIIYGISILTIGEAKGHGVFIDETMLVQVITLAEEKEPSGVKSRFDHPGACSRAIGTFTGRFHKFRRDEDRVRADLHLADAAAKSPEGDLRTYILDLAAEDPDAFATSIVFRADDSFVPDSADKDEPGAPPEDDPFWLPHARVAALHHCDIVDEGAANDGLFGRPDYWAEQAESWARAHPGAIGRMLSVYNEWKQKLGEKKMADTEKKETASELATALTLVETGKVELDKATATIAEMKAEAETKTAEAAKTATADVFSRVKTRLEKYKNPAFVTETIEMSDDEVKDAYIARLEKGTDDGEKTVDFSETETDGDKETFETKVAEKVEAGLTRGKAITECAGEFPKLHKDYIKRTNESRTNTDD